MSDIKIKILLDELKQDNVSGANELIFKALNILKFYSECQLDESKDIRDGILQLSKEIINSRPSMAPLINATGFIIQNLDSITKKDILARIEQFYRKKSNIEKNLENTFKNFIANQTKEIKKIMLISYSSTITNLFIQLKEYNYEIFIMESRPLLEGHHTAKILSSKFKTHIIIDAAIGKFIDQIDLVLIGIDSILKDGAIINKIGSLPLAILAYERGIDIFAVGESLKYNLKSHFGLNIKIEEKPIEEVYNLKVLNKNLVVHNYYFDIVSSKYITGIISDFGVLKPQTFVKKAQKILPISWFEEFFKNNQ